jgi:hypothetical protein
MEVRMKKLLTPVAIAVATLVVAVGPAYAPSKGDTQNMLQKQLDEQQKRENKDVDRAYSDTMKRTGTGAAKPYDPWGSVRPADKK